MGLRMKNFDIMGGFTEKSKFQGGVRFLKNQYIGGIKNGGLDSFQIYEGGVGVGGLGKKELGCVFEVGSYPNAHYVNIPKLKLPQRLPNTHSK